MPKLQLKYFITEVKSITTAIQTIDPGPPVASAIAVPEMLPTPKLPPSIAENAAKEDIFFLQLSEDVKNKALIAEPMPVI